MAIVHEEHYTFLTISHPVLRMRNVSDKSCRENQNTHFMFKILFLEIHAICEMMWKKIVEQDRPHMLVWHRHGTCWITEAISTFVICNTYCFSAATVVAQTHLSVMLYLHCLSCFCSCGGGGCGCSSSSSSVVVVVVVVVVNSYKCII